MIARLSDHFASDDVDVVEFERRVDLAHRAATAADLDALVADLPAPGEALEAPPPQQIVIAQPGRTPRRRTMVAIMSGVDRKGQWLVPRKLRMLAAMGGMQIDFRDTNIPSGVTEIAIYAFMGGVHLIVPPGLSVEMDGIAVMGGFEELDRSPRTPDPDAPLLRITGFCLMGGVSVETRLSGESSRDARRRTKREQKQLVARRSAKEDE